MKNNIALFVLGLSLSIVLCCCDDSTSASSSDSNENSKVDTLVIRTKDSLVVNHIDTLVIRDSVFVYDTTVVIDTLEFNNIDTVIVKDTVYTLLKTLCGEKEYDPETQYCKDDEIVDKIACRYDYYNPETEMCDTRDGQIYKIVQIGSQTWMAQNMNFRYVYSTDSSSFCYNNDARMCEKYGRLYTWSAAVDSLGKYSTSGEGCGFTHLCDFENVVVRGVCPEGWHVPSHADWNTLVESVGGLDSAGYKLETKLGWYNALLDSLGYEIVYGGVDEFGFSGLPAGSRYGDTEQFSGIGIGADFWSTGLYESKLGNNIIQNPEIFFFVGGYVEAHLSGMIARTAESVRCLKD